MKAFLASILWVAAVALALPASAQDQSKHQEHAAGAPDCASMKHMDKSKMDMNDPDMKAMHERCMQHMHGQGQGGAAGAEPDQSGGKDTHGDGSAPAQHDRDKGGN